MRTLSFTITGQRIAGSPISDLIGNTKNYVQASFDFSDASSSAWSGLLKFAVFTANSKQYYALLQYDQTLQKDACKVPDVAMTGEYMDVGVIAGHNGTILTTDTARVRIDESVRVKPPYDMINMYEPILEQIAALETSDAAKQPKTLDISLEIGGTVVTTVEAALAALNLRTMVFDAEFSDSSTNAVQNKVVKAALEAKQGKTLDTAITIGGVEYTTVEGALAGLLGNDVEVDSSLDAQSTNPVQNKVIKSLMDSKQPKTLENAISVGGVSKTTVQEALEAINSRTTDIDDALSSSSTNPVQNKKVKEAVDAKQNTTLSSSIMVNGVEYTTVETVLSAINTLLANHVAAEVATSGGVHHFRKDPNSSDLQYYDSQSEAWITISSGGGGGSVTVDTALSTTSTNPVQNKALTNYMYDNLQPKTMSSSVTIGGVQYTTVEAAIGAIIGAIPAVDAALDASSTNAIQNKAVKAAVDLKQGKTLETALNIGGQSRTTVEAALGALNDVADSEAEARAQADFEALYELCDRTTTIGTDLQGHKQITEVDTDNGMTAVTAIVNTSSTVKTITTVIQPTSPSAGDNVYTKTTTVTKTSGGKTVAESYAVSTYSE